jgi:hypothetical protein
MQQAASQSSAYQPVFVDHAIATRTGQYVELLVDARKVLQDWRASLLAHELVDKNGFVKGDDDISETRLEKREVVRSCLTEGQAIEKPILGIGIFDNVEIGAGSDVLATLVMEGFTILPVHVRTSQLRDFDAFRA